MSPHLVQTSVLTTCTGVTNLKNYTLLKRPLGPGKISF